MAPFFNIPKRGEMLENRDELTNKYGTRCNIEAIEQNDGMKSRTEREGSHGITERDGDLDTDVGHSQDIFHIIQTLSVYLCSLKEE